MGRIGTQISHGLGADGSVLAFLSSVPFIVQIKDDGSFTRYPFPVLGDNIVNMGYLDMCADTNGEIWAGYDELHNLSSILQVELVYFNGTEWITLTHPEFDRIWSINPFSDGGIIINTDVGLYLNQPLP